MTSVPESVEEILNGLVADVVELVTSPLGGSLGPAITHAAARLEALRPKAPMGGEVEEALREAFLAGADQGHATGAHANIYARNAMDALAQGPKEEGDAPPSWPTRGHVAAIVREVRNNTIDTPDAVDKLLALFPAQPPSLTFSDEQVERAARAHYAHTRPQFPAENEMFWDHGLEREDREPFIAAMRAALSTLEPK